MMELEKSVPMIILGIIFLVFIAVSLEQAGVEKIYIKNISTDKAVYHSSDVMNLSLSIYSNSDLENVTVTANGINKKFNAAKTLELKKGSNDVSFIYTLPRCNVCGGISAGDYNLSCIISYKNISVEASTMINIQQ